MKPWPRIPQILVDESGEIYSDSLILKRRLVIAARTKKQYGHYKACGVKNPIGGKYLSLYEHRIVCETYHPIDNPKDFEVNHIDSNKINNHPSNLEWASKSENRKHAYRVGANPLSKKIGESNGRAKLNWVSVGIIREALKEGFTTVEIGKYFNVSQTLISSISLNKNWIV